MGGLTEKLSAPISSKQFLYVDMVANHNKIGIATSFNKVWYNWALLQTSNIPDENKTVIEVDGEMVCISNLGQFILMIKMNQHLKRGFVLIHDVNEQCDVDNFINNTHFHPKFQIKSHYERHLQNKKNEPYFDFNICIPEIGEN